VSDSRTIIDKARVPTRVLRGKPPPITIVPISHSEHPGTQRLHR
jgi:hypothetical protein